MSQSLHRWRHSLVGAALALVVVTGCSEDPPEPKMPDATASPTETSSPSPTGPVEPTPPPEMEGKDAAAAEAFVEYYFAMLNHAQATGETSAVKRLGLPGCRACAAAVETVKSAYADGGSIRGGEFTVRSVRAQPRPQLSDGVVPFSAQAKVHSSRQVVSSPDKAEPTVYDPAVVNIELSLVRDREAWRIGEWSVS